MPDALPLSPSRRPHRNWLRTHVCISFSSARCRSVSPSFLRPSDCSSGGALRRDLPVEAAKRRVGARKTVGIAKLTGNVRESKMSTHEGSMRNIEGRFRPIKLPIRIRAGCSFHRVLEPFLLLETVPTSKRSFGPMPICGSARFE